MFNRKVNVQEIKREITIYLKAVLIAVITTMVAVLLFAVVLKFLDISNTAILTTNQIIKIASILLACFIVNKKHKINMLKGLIIGITYTIIAYLVFSILSSDFGMDISFLYNLLFSAVIGLISGIIVKGIKRT